MDEPTYNIMYMKDELYRCSLCGGAVGGAGMRAHNAWHSALFKSLSK